MDFSPTPVQIDAMTADPHETMIPGLDVPVSAIRDMIGAVTRDEILSRFRNLSDGQIGEKRPGEVVTEADLAAETALTLALTDIVGDCVIVGEEGVETDPGMLKRLDDAAPVFVLDPVDGTQNFANGLDCFAVIVAYRFAGETLAGWIHDPVSDITCWAVKGAGAHFDDGSPVTCVGNREIDALTGCFGLKARTAMENKADSMRPNLASRYRCVGREYFDLCAGRLDFIQFGQRLKPWDHAAGDLIVREAGFVSRMTETGGDYTPGEDGIARGNLLIAPDEAIWQALHNLMI